MNDRITTSLMANVHSYRKRVEARREKQLWQPIDGPCFLKEALLMRTKSDIDKIRQNYGIPGVSHLNKEALVDHLSNSLPIMYEALLEYLDESIYRVLKDCAESDGLINGEALSYETINILAGFGLAFTGSINGQKSLFLPKEFQNSFEAMDQEKLEEKVEKNSELLKLINGLLYYYGLVDTFTLNNQVNQYLDEKLSYVYFINKLKFFERLTPSFSRNSAFVSRKGIYNISQLAEKIEARGDLTPYHFTKEALLEAGRPGFIEDNSPVKQFKELLIESYDLNHEQVHRIVEPILVLIKSGTKPTEVLDHLQMIIELPSFEFAQKVSRLLMEINNHTRLWTLKGHKPYDLFDPTKLKPFPKSSKIGRNEPCPCGSGKKYKKCCL